MTTIALKDSKAKILESFQQILAERQKIDSRVATREEEVAKAENQKILEAATQYTADHIIRSLADLQLEFSTIITGLSTRLTTENSRLDELKQAIEVETQHLQELQQTRVVADALYLLRQEHQENLRLLEERLLLEQETLEKERSEAQKQWQREQEEHETLVTENHELQTRERERQEEEYQYETDRSRTIATDEYEEFQRKLERELRETGQEKEKQWAERERVLAANQALLDEYRQKVATIPTELDEAIKKAREEGIRDANHDAKIKADLFDKEWDAAKQGYELQIQSLEARVQKQMEQITEITAQLQAATRQAQDLAMRAFENSATRSTRRTEPAAEREAKS